MELKQLEYFRHVAELGSFTRAASFLSVVQPALSRQVRQLEVELGQNLFERNGRGVVLTVAGTRLLEHTRGILTQVGRARQELEAERDGDTGHLTLGLPPSLGTTITVPLVKAFVEQLPNARLATVEGLSVYMLEWLGVGRVDCALIYNADQSPRVDFDPLLTDHLLLIEPLDSAVRSRTSATRLPRRTPVPKNAATRPAATAVARPPATAVARPPATTATRPPATAAPIALDALEDYPLIMPSRPHAMRMAVENALAGVARKIRVVHEIESIPAIIDLVRQGHGFGVLPRSAVSASRWADEVIVRPIRDPLLTISLSIATSSQRPRTPLMRKAIDVIRAVVERELRRSEH